MNLMGGHKNKVSASIDISNLARKDSTGLDFKEVNLKKYQNYNDFKGYL